MNEEDAELWNRLVETADKLGAHNLTIMKFTANWRVGFFTPIAREDIASMAVGKTFAEAAREALENPDIGPPQTGAEQMWPASRPRGPK
jgi:hypothetical protein